MRARHFHSHMLVLVLAIAVLDGCVMRHGEDLDQLGFGNARGAHVQLRLERGFSPERIEGELLEVSDTTYLVLAGDTTKREVWLVLHDDVRSIRTDWATTQSGEVVSGVPVSPAQLRRASRFPYGIQPAALQRVLAGTGQTAPRMPVRAQSSSTAPNRENATAHDHNEVHVASADSFLQLARAASARYSDRSLAIADGYRRLGPPFPAMGEHWVHPGLIVSGRIDAAYPPVLSYAEFDGTPSLVSVAYAVPLMPGEPAPETPLGPSIWHQHGDDIDAETLLLVHASPDDDPNAPRLAMFHAWTVLDNPDGMFAQNNWRLPFTQLGLHADRPSPAAAQALSLLTVGVDYYMRLYDVITGHDTTRRNDVHDAITAAAQQAREWFTSLEDRDEVEEVRLSELEQIWIALGHELSLRVEGEDGERLGRAMGLRESHR